MAEIDKGVVVALIELSQQVREGTLRLLHVPDPSWLTWAPSGTSNHLLWHGGHALWLQDVLTIQPLTGRSELPNGWKAIFGQGSEPATVRHWPSDSEVRDWLGRQLARIEDLLTEYQGMITRWANDIKYKYDSGSDLAGMIHGWHDEARHQGEMYLLHKLCRARTS